MLDEELVKKIDEVDDKLWEVAHQLNDYFDVGLDFDSFEHSEFSINIRETLLEEMKKYNEVELTYDYELVSRPYSIGCQPSGVVSYDESKGKYGVVSYDRPLTEQELDDYELREWTEVNLLNVYIGDKEVYAIENNEGWFLDVEADYFKEEYYTEKVIRALDNKVISEGLLPLEPNENGIISVPEENIIIYNKTDSHVSYPIEYQVYEKDNGMKI